MADLFRRITDSLSPLQLQELVDRRTAAGGWHAIASRHWAAMVSSARSVWNEDLSRRAGALTYQTLLSLVPILAVAFALFKAFGGLRSLEGPLREFIVENLAAGRAEQVGDWLDKFISNVNAGAIAGVGVLVLFYSATSMLTGIEDAFNQIWGVRQKRPIHLRFAIYWCILTLTPLLLAISISASARLHTSAFSKSSAHWLLWVLEAWLLKLGSVIAVCFGLAVAYYIVPNTRVRIRSALVGGLVGGVFWSLSKTLFIAVTTGSVKYSAVYGALGVLPLLILWLYLSWNVVLFGATYTYAYQSASLGQLAVGSLNLSSAFRERLANRLMYEIAHGFFHNRQNRSDHALAQTTGIPLPVVRRVLDVLIREQWVTPVRRGRDDEDMDLLPGRTLASIRPNNITHAVRIGDGTELPIAANANARELDDLVTRAEEAAESVLSELTFEDLVAAP